MFQLLALDARFSTVAKPTTPGMYDRIFRNKGSWCGQTCHQQELLHVGYRHGDNVLGYWAGDRWVSMEEDKSEWIN